MGAGAVTNPFAPPKAPIDPQARQLQGDILEVSFRNSFWDLLLFQAYANLRSPVNLLMYAGFAALIASASWNESRVLAIATGVVLFLGFALLTLVVITIMVVVHRDANFYHPRTLSISAHSIVDITELTRHEMQWPAVHGVVRTPWCLYIRLSPFSAHCLPPRVFESRDAYARYADAATTYFNLSRKP
jgi:hypothetical protein